jgi:hypothetical protein
MEDRAAPRYDVSVGDVHDSQLVIGNHNTVQTTAGTKVTILQVGEKPAPRLRPLPVLRRPDAAEILGRGEELDLVRAATKAAPVQLYGPDGSGKTSVLKVAAMRATPAAEGVVFESARHRSLDEIQALLYAAFWECDPRFTPAPGEFDEFLADREAILVLDDCGFDRDDLAALLDRLPRSTVVLASAERTLWSRGTARTLPDLDPDVAVALLERELGRAFESDERRAAEAIVARLGGNPQSLVEAAALIEDGWASLRDLGDDPDLLSRRFDPAALTDSRKRILAVLAALDRAALGAEHIAAVTGIRGAGEELRELERRGWAKAGSPRYRSVRSMPPEVACSREGIAKMLLAHLTAWTRRSSPEAVAEEAEGIEAALRLGTDIARWDEVLALSLAAERGLFLSATWSSCRRVLQTGLRAAGTLENRSAYGFLLHQLGSQSLCLGDPAGAEEQLTEALRVRESLGETEAAALTRHNLEQLRGGGGGGADGDGSGPGAPGLPRLPIALGVLAAIVAAVGVIALAGGGGGRTPTNGSSGEASGGSSTAATGGTSTSSGTGSTTSPPVEPPSIEIASPSDGSTFDVKSVTGAVASFACDPAEGGEVESCEGAIDGATVENGGALAMSVGAHTLVVNAIENEEVRATAEADYSVEAVTRGRGGETTPPPPVEEVTPEEAPPEIEPTPEEEPAVETEEGGVVVR